MNFNPKFYTEVLFWAGLALLTLEFKNVFMATPTTFGWLISFVLTAIGIVDIIFTVFQFHHKKRPVKKKSVRKWEILRRYS